MPVRRWWLLFALCLGVSALALAQGEEAAAKVHDHVAYTFRAPEDGRTPAMRASAASQTLTAAIDEGVPGDVQVVVRGNVAEVRLGERLLFRLTPEDARLDGGGSLAEYAPRVQTALDSFVSRERKRARLQQGVLAVSLAVFFAVLLFVLLRAFFRITRVVERKLERGDEVLPASMRSMIGEDSQQARGVVLFTLSAARIVVSIVAVYVLALASLSLFDTTRPFRDRLASWAAAPFRAMAGRLVHGLPNIILLLVLLAVLRAGWQSMSVGFARVSKATGARAIQPYQVIAYRLIARFALVIGALLMLPLALGAEMGLFTAIGLLLLGVLGVGLLPLLANVAVGLHALITNQYPLGGWVRVRLPGGHTLAGEVTSVDFFHVRLVPESAGELRLPHLVALWSAVDHLPTARPLTVELSVLRARVEPKLAFTELSAAAARAIQEQGLKTSATLELLELTPEHARFRIAIPDAPESLRTPLLLALSEIGRAGANGRLVEPARVELARGGATALVAPEKPPKGDES